MKNAATGSTNREIRYGYCICYWVYLGFIRDIRERLRVERCSKMGAT